MQEFHFWLDVVLLVANIILMPFIIFRSETPIGDRMIALGVGLLAFSCLSYNVINGL